jgi:hypothetical protein
MVVVVVVMMMETVSTSEASGSFYQTSCWNVTEDSRLHICGCENVISSLDGVCGRLSLENLKSNNDVSLNCNLKIQYHIVTWTTKREVSAFNVLCNTVTVDG